MMSQGTAISKALVAPVVVAIVAVAAAGYFSYSSPGGPASGPTTKSNEKTPPHTNSTTNPNNKISLRNFGLVAHGGIYPTPYLSGEIWVNASVPWSSYSFYTNDTSCGTRDFGTGNTATTVVETTNGNTTKSYTVTTTVTNTATQFVYMFKGGPCIPVTAGKTYSITFVVTFSDGTTATATVAVVAQ
jgi:hypothetical protein